jgi:heterotetrameric sarcosine oxidase gamma subunit
MGPTATAPVARSPIAPSTPQAILYGWEVSARSSSAALTIVDETPRAKVSLKAPWNGSAAKRIGVLFGRAERDSTGALVIGSGPGEWLVVGEPGTESDLTTRWQVELGDAAKAELVTVLNLTHGRALLRLCGEDCAPLLSKVCAVDLTESMAPNGAAFRSSVARLVTDVVRDDTDGVPSFLLHCERSSGQYLFDAILDAGAEFGIDVDGFGRPD